MATPSPGDPKIDKQIANAIKAISDLLGDTERGAPVLSNGSYADLQDLASYSSRLTVAAFDHVRIKGTQKVGGREGARRAKEKRRLK